MNKLYLANEKKSYHTCVELSVAIFQDCFNHQIKNLLSAFPPDYVSEQSKKPFWSGLKRVPTALQLDLNDPVHSELIQAGANIYAAIFNIPLEKDKAKVMEIAKTVKPIAFIPKKVKIEVDEKKQNKEQPIMVNEDD